MNNEEQEAQLSCCGWLVVEIIERMMRLNFSLDEICDALDLPSESHLAYLLMRATTERKLLLGGLDSG